MADERLITGHERPRKKRRAISLATKLEVLERYEKGERAVHIAKTLGLRPSTVRTIRDNGSKIRRTAEAVALRDAPYVSRHRGEPMEKMERLLSIWLEDLRRRGSAVTMGAVQKKALSLFKDLKNQLGEGSSREVFIASRGWFERFKRRRVVQSLTNEELILLDEIRAEEENRSEERDSRPEPTQALTTRFLSDVFQALDNLTAALMENDPNRERSLTVCRNLQYSVECYREIYKQKKKAGVRHVLDAFLEEEGLQRKEDSEDREDEMNEEVEHERNDGDYFIKEEDIIVDVDDSMLESDE